jgi:hypothetical protein
MADIQNGIKTIANYETGKMTITLVRDGADRGSTEIETREAAKLAVMLLMTAKAAFDMAGKRPNLARSVSHSFNLQPTSVAVGSSPIPDCEALIFAFGETEVGIAIPRSHLGALGQQLMALGGPQDRPAH